MTRWLGTTAVIAAALAALALAGDASAPGALAGRVADLEEAPIAGARVVLGAPDGRDLEPLTTDAGGRWRQTGLAPGRWRIRVEAVGFLSGAGTAEVAAGEMRRVDLWLRPIDEVSPAFWEGNPGRLERWLEHGNDFLAQGRHAEARREYGKALPHLPPAERPAVLRAVARAYYLESDLAAARLALEQALHLAPADAPTRALFVELVGADGERRAAEDYLEALDRGEVAPPPPPASPPVMLPAPGPLAPPARRPAAPHLVGRFTTALATASPLSTGPIVGRRLGLEAAPAAARSYELAEESFFVYVPESYRPGAGFGLLVWVSPTVFGGFTREEVAAALDEARLIWVGPHGAGNARPRADRYGLALDAAAGAGELWDIDPLRVYVGGYSGGGRVASGLALHFPEVFRGALSLSGCDWFEPLAVPDRPGARWPAALPRPPSEDLERLRRDARFVLVTGELDFNRAQTRQTWKAMVAAGFERVTSLVVPGASHYTPLALKDWRRALAALAVE